MVALEAVRRGPSNKNFSKIAFPNFGFSKKNYQNKCARCSFACKNNFRVHYFSPFIAVDVHYFSMCPFPFYDLAYALPHHKSLPRVPVPVRIFSSIFDFSFVFLSFFSCISWASMLSVATGLASSLLILMGSPVSSQ